MSRRREVLAGALCALAAGAAWALEPHRRVSLLGRRSLAQLVPTRVGGYASHDVTDLVAPKEDDSLAARLYGETVGRVYAASEPGSPDIMMLLAYGSTQNDALQLHRPEVCYPFSGYEVSGLRSMPTTLAPGVVLPCRTLVATAGDQRETIIYWSRLGESFPLDHRQQQWDRLELAAHGEIADGVLARFSIAGVDPDEARRAMLAFIPALILSVAPGARDVLIGTQRAALLSAGRT